MSKLTYEQACYAMQAGVGLREKLGGSNETTAAEAERCEVMHPLADEVLRMVFAFTPKDDRRESVRDLARRIDAALRSSPSQAAEDAKGDR